ncbi:battenin isoform X1 [Gadus macrocephalus]|uniref:battenin isoform X1 n=2 Tax=Gadus macrocephalus TaxID=80720 RepID=UPI0028CB8094|nr:battenin isoform X1 [Gadus macrocephalus]
MKMRRGCETRQIMDEADSLDADRVIPNNQVEGRSSKIRNWSGFWLLGLCNNFAYVVMLSAAHDILTKQQSDNSTTPTPPSLNGDFEVRNSSNSTRYDCNPVSTAVVLLADILPSLVIKLSATFYIHHVPYGFRVLFCVGATVTSFLLVSFSTTMSMSILGVVFASMGSGLGELSFLSLTAFFSSDVLEGWGSGTGGAGVAGALMYSALTQAGLSPPDTLLTMLLVPAAMLLSYFFLLAFPPMFPQWRRLREAGPMGRGGAEERRRLMDEREEEEEEEEEESEQQEKGPREDRANGPLSCTEKMRAIKMILKFVLPLGTVYYAEYFINQGLLELLYFPKSTMTHAEQYRWYQTLYQVGVLVSRSSLRCVKIRNLWALALLQIVNTVFLLSAVYFQFLPAPWLVFIIVLYEGLLGGAAYVNTFYFISKESGDREREFAMAAASVGDTLGIALAALTAFPAHSYFCSL